MKCVLALILLSPALFAQPGWKTIKDRTGACQISVPPYWTPLSMPGYANSPDHTATRILVGISPFRPFSDTTLKMLNIGTLFENSAQRSFWVTNPNGGSPSLVTYHVETPGKGNRCVAEVALPPQHYVDEAKKTAMSVSPVR